MAEQPSMMEMLKQARTMQKQMKQIQKRVEKRDLSVKSPDEKIEIVITGKLQVRRILIDQSLLENPNKVAFQDALTSTVNLAIQRAQNIMAVEMQKMAGDMGLPQDAMNEAFGDTGGEAGDDDPTGGGADAGGGGRLRKWFGR